jgi:hypothetical protein
LLCGAHGSAMPAPPDYPLAAATRNAVRPDAAIETGFCRTFAEG